jgi:asparagine synthase (glutamine-hydrolysing)
VFGLLGRLYPNAAWAPRVLRAKATFEAFARNSLEAYFYSMCVLPDEIRCKLFTERFRSELQGYTAIEVFKRHAARAPSDHPLSLVQYLDFKTYLVGDINTKVDRASMAHSLEVREPLMDHPLVEWLSSLPPAFKLRKRDGKYLLKKALAPYLPPEILYRPKMGFAVPLAQWFRGPLRQQIRDAVLGPVLAETGWFNAAYLLRLVEDHQSGLRNYSTPLWTLLMFESFLRNVMNAPATGEARAGLAHSDADPMRSRRH